MRSPLRKEAHGCSPGAAVLAKQPPTGAAGRTVKTTWLPSGRHCIHNTVSQMNIRMLSALGDARKYPTIQICKGMGMGHSRE